MKIINRLKAYYNAAYLNDHFPSLSELLPDGKKIFAYYGYLGDKNFGDELVFESAKKLFYPDILLPVRKRMPVHLSLYSKIFASRISGMVIGGGTLIGPLFWDRAFFEAIAASGKPIYVHGTGVKKKEAFNEGWKKILAGNVFGGVRGPMSKDYLEEISISMKVIGDAALNMFDDSHWPIKQRDEKKVLVNLGTHFNYNGEAKSRNELRKFIKMLMRQGYNVQFLPFHSIDVKLGLELKSEYPEMILLDIPQKYADALIHFQSAAFAVGERLHFTVMALLAGCPFLSINYAKKHEDFLESVNFSQAGVAPPDILPGTIISAFEKRHFFDRESIPHSINGLKKIQHDELYSFRQRIKSAHAVYS